MSFFNAGGSADAVLGPETATIAHVKTAIDTAAQSHTFAFSMLVSLSTDEIHGVSGQRARLTSATNFEKPI
jgi:hypothetical protein